MNEAQKNLLINSSLIGITTGTAVYFGAITFPLITAPSIILSALLPTAWHYMTYSFHFAPALNTNLSDNQKFDAVEFRSKLISILNSFILFGALSYGCLAFPFMGFYNESKVSVGIIIAGLTYLITSDLTSVRLERSADTNQLEFHPLLSGDKMLEFWSVSLTMLVSAVISAILPSIIPVIIGVAILSTETGRSAAKTVVNFGATNVTRVYGFLRDTASNIVIPAHTEGSPGQQRP